MERQEITEAEEASYGPRDTLALLGFRLFSSHFFVVLVLKREDIGPRSASNAVQVEFEHGYSTFRTISS